MAKILAKALVFVFMTTDVYTKETGTKINAMEKATNGFPMETFMLESTTWAKSKVKDFTLGKMEIHMTASGIQAKSMVMVYGKATLATTTWANGNGTKHMAMVCTNGATKTATKVNGVIV